MYVAHRGIQRFRNVFIIIIIRIVHQGQCAEDSTEDTRIKQVFVCKESWIQRNSMAGGILFILSEIQFSSQWSLS